MPGWSARRSPRRNAAAETREWLHATMLGTVVQTPASRGTAGWDHGPGVEASAERFLAHTFAR